MNCFPTTKTPSRVSCINSNSTATATIAEKAIHTFIRNIRPLLSYGITVAQRALTFLVACGFSRNALIIGRSISR